MLRVHKDQKVLQVILGLQGLLVIPVLKDHLDLKERKGRREQMEPQVLKVVEDPKVVKV